jgi:hypothetical protein
MNPRFTDPLVQPLTDPPSKIYVDAYSSYHLPLGSTTTQSFGMNPSSFGFPEGLEKSYFSTTLVVDIVGASYLLETSMNQVTLTQPLVRTSSISHASSSIPSLLFTHMHTPSALLGHSIGQMASNQVIYTTMITQATQPPY